MASTAHTTAAPTPEPTGNMSLDTLCLMEDVRMAKGDVDVCTLPKKGVPSLASSEHRGDLNSTSPSVLEKAGAGDDEDSRPGQYLTGARLALASLGLVIALFIVGVEVSIVSTSLVTISNNLQGDAQSSWIVTAYLLSYTGFLIIWSKINDVTGIRPPLLVSLAVFLAFSAGCGAAQTMNQLIICRAFQGMGGAGVYSLTAYALLQIGKPAIYDKMSSLCAFTMSLGLIVGPLLGGAINNGGDWRWVFFINLPPGAVAAVLIVFFIPSKFPYHADPTHINHQQSFLSFRGVRTFFTKLDFVGAILLLGTSLLLVAALVEGGLRFAWSSGTIVSFLLISGGLAIGFFLWEWLISRDGTNSAIEAMFPCHFWRNRVWMGCLLGTFLSGIPLTIAVIEIPQRFQIVNSESPLGAGVQFLSYACAQPFGSIVGAGLIGRKIPIIYIFIVGFVIQIVGFALLSTIPTPWTFDIWKGQHGYMVLAGLGTGMVVSANYMMGPIVVEKRFKALSIGAVIQLRMLGGAVGIAVANAILNNTLKQDLSLGGDQLELLLSSTSSMTKLPTATQDQVRHAFSMAYNKQTLAIVAFCAAQVFSIALMWKRGNIRLIKE